MSSISVCQGLQSCLEPRVNEPRVLRLKLAPPPPSESESQQPEKKESATAWSFLQPLSHLPSKHNNHDDRVYVHPTLKRSSSMLTAKSLEMCTESLGSETGTHQNHLFSTHNHTKSDHDETSIKHRRRANKAHRSFPPPLTTITNHGGALRVMPHRQDGRLVLEAVASSPPESGTCFHAERSHGRLRLGVCLYHDDKSESQEENDDDEEEEEVVRQFGRAMSNGMRCMEGGGNTHFYSFFDLRTSIV